MAEPDPHGPRRGARLALVSARITERSARAWTRWPRAARAMLEAFDLILAQDTASQARLAEALGGRVAGRLNLKRVGAPLGADRDRDSRRLKAAIGGRPVVAGGQHPSGRGGRRSPRPCDALAPRPLLILAPSAPGAAATRSPRQFAGRRPGRGAPGRGAGAADTDIYLADTLGEIGLVLSRWPDVAVMGGSFGHDIGGHNPLEPARLGVPVLTGPDIANFVRPLCAELAPCRRRGGHCRRCGRHLSGGARGGLVSDDPAARRTGWARRRSRSWPQGEALEFEAALDLIRPLLPAR